MDHMNILARGLSLTGAEEQAQLLDEWSACLFDICHGHSRFEDQCCHIARSLGPSGRRLVKELAGYVATVEEREAEERKR